MFQPIKRFYRNLPLIPRALYLRWFVSPKRKRELMSEFHNMYYNAGNGGGSWNDTRWLGHRTKRNPMDLLVFQEMIFDVKPDLIIETGAAHGGGALYFASVCEMLNKGHVVSIDIVPDKGRPKHPRITYVDGSSAEWPAALGDRAAFNTRYPCVMVFLDSDHTKQHVLKELQLYAPYIRIGSYIVVEDTHVNNHPVDPNFGAGPWEAVEDFLKGNEAFEIDRSREKHFLTFNPNGFLRRIK